ncbi:hypothetical protein K7X08_031079 [Anisodus acutangulus]|uniref:Uncharacterized protein n=1 Tax=Anisodus acutangulus TaxID=402998 RepID=A0A9Q1MR01_9SOLA|nr:hypothetical protein K7X08_031079 [Anisodus acutangulus]
MKNVSIATTIDNIGKKLSNILLYYVSEIEDDEEEIELQSTNLKDSTKKHCFTVKAKLSTWGLKGNIVIKIREFHLVKILAA